MASKIEGLAVYLIVVAVGLIIIATAIIISHKKDGPEPCYVIEFNTGKTVCVPKSQTNLNH